MRSIALAAAAASLLLAGCSPAATTTSGDRSTMRAPSVNESEEYTDGTEINIRAEAFAIRNKVPAPPARVFAALAEVYRELGIPVAGSDPATMTLGNNNFTATRRLGGTRLTQFFDCGNQRGIPNAESYTIRMDIRSTVLPDPDGSAVSTTIQAAARSNDGTSSQPVACRTLTKLEERIANMAALKIVQ
jgi:hypothetical protein